MGEYDTVIADLERTRERTVDLIRAKLDAVAEQVREAAARTVSDLGVVLPADPEALFPVELVREKLAQAAELSAAPAAGPTVGLEIVQALDSGRSQSEVLQELLQQLAPFCGPRAIVVFRENQVSGWAAAGLEEGCDARAWRGNAAESEGLRLVMEGRPVMLDAAADQLLVGWPGVRAEQTLLVPMSMRGKVVGALLAQGVEGRLDSDAIQVVTFLAGLLLETLTVRPTVPTPAIAPFLELAPSPRETPEPAELESAPEAVQVEAVPEPEPVADVEPPPQAVAPEAAEVPESAAAEPVDAGTTVEVPVPTPAPVVPPRTPEEDRKHEEARRFARLLVSEIRLYNEQAVQEGKKAGDIYQRLKEDIDRSREMYEQRVPSEVRSVTNFFFEELVRILADGDADALGL